MLASLLRFDRGVLHIHLLSDSVGPTALDRIAGMAEDAGATLSVHDIAATLNAQPFLARSAYISRATYGRILAAELLPSDLDRVIYLDVDLLCRASLRPLWSCDLGGAVAGAVPDCAVGRGAPAERAASARKTRDRHAAHLGLSADGTYVNSGVMLIDLARWRCEGVGSALLTWLRNNAARQQFGDQDALNCVLRGRLAMLDDRWNRLARWETSDPDANTHILHFAGPDKPWHRDYRGSGVSEWRAVCDASPFRDAALIDLRRLASH